MDFDLRMVLTAAGPTASLVFASWMFLSYLQQRYAEAYNRYRNLIDEVRKNPSPEQHHSIRQQVLLYKRRCEQVRVATDIGVISAMLLITTVVTGTINVAIPSLAILKYVSIACAVTGLVLVIVAASFVLRENALIQTAIEAELSDVPALMHR